MVAVTTCPSPLYTDVNMLVLQPAGIPYIGQSSFGHKSTLGLSYIFSVEMIVNLKYYQREEDKKEIEVD